MPGPVPTTAETIAAAMDPWARLNGPCDLFDQLAAHVGQERAVILWNDACRIHDNNHTT